MIGCKQNYIQADINAYTHENQNISTKKHWSTVKTVIGIERI